MQIQICQILTSFGYYDFFPRAKKSHSVSMKVIILFSGNHFTLVRNFSCQKIKSICCFYKKMKAVQKDWTGAMLGSVSTLTQAEQACLWWSSYAFSHHFGLQWGNELRWWPLYSRGLQAEGAGTYWQKWWST